MNRLITEFLAIFLVMLCSIAAIAEAQPMDKNQALSAKQQGIVPIAAFTAKGDLEKLKVSLNEGLDAGLTVNEIKEILVQLYAYTGFPRSLNGIGTFMGVMEERQKKGIKDEAGREASPLPVNKSSVELGTEIQTRLVGKPVSGVIHTFAPAIERATCSVISLGATIWTSRAGRLLPFRLWPAWMASIPNCRPISTSGSIPA